MFAGGLTAVLFLFASVIIIDRGVIVVSIVVSISFLVLFSSVSSSMVSVRTKKQPKATLGTQERVKSIF
jgi:hypothetical protein